MEIGKRNSQHGSTHTRLGPARWGTRASVDASAAQHGEWGPEGGRGRKHGPARQRIERGAGRPAHDGGGGTSASWPSGCVGCGRISNVFTDLFFYKKMAL